LSVIAVIAKVVTVETFWQTVGSPRIVLAMPRNRPSHAQTSVHKNLTPRPSSPPPFHNAGIMKFLILGTSTHINVPVWNPLYAIAPMVLLPLAIPLALFALFTFSLAITVLVLRAAVVYTKIGFVLLCAWINPPTNNLHAIRSTSSPKRSTAHRKRPSRNTQMNAALPQDGAPRSRRSSRPIALSESLTSLVGESDIRTDFEGVGGWRVTGDDDEEALWMGLNARLEAPGSGRHHHRSLTDGATPGAGSAWSPDLLRTSPAQSRARTPARFVVDDDDYFPSQSTPGLRPSSTPLEPPKHHSRKKSGAGSSSSSIARATHIATSSHAG